MSKPNAKRASMISPYLSLREAVRPAIFAYTLMASEQEQAGALAEECESLLHVTRELLKTAALVHVLSPEPGHSTPPDGSGSDRQAKLLDAYAEAGMLWAKVMGSFMAIGSLLLRQQQWDEVQHLAALVENVGESEAAKTLRARVSDARAERLRRQIASYHGNMSAEKIREAIELLHDLPEDFPRRRNEIARALGPICTSMVNLSPPSGFTKYGYVHGDGCQEARADGFLLDISSEFHKIYAKKAGKG